MTKIVSGILGIGFYLVSALSSLQAAPAPPPAETRELRQAEIPVSSVNKPAAKAETTSQGCTDSLSCLEAAENPLLKVEELPLFTEEPEVTAIPEEDPELIMESKKSLEEILKDRTDRMEFLKAELQKHIRFLSKAGISDEKMDSYQKQFREIHQLDLLEKDASEIASLLQTPKGEAAKKQLVEKEGYLKNLAEEMKAYQSFFKKHASIKKSFGLFEDNFRKTSRMAFLEKQIRYLKTLSR